MKLHDSETTLVTDLTAISGYFRACSYDPVPRTASTALPVPSKYSDVDVAEGVRQAVTHLAERGRSKIVLVRSFAKTTSW